MADFILAIDQGTTSSRVVIFDQQAKQISQHQQEFTQHFPNDGWVEHDPEEIWQSVVTCMQQAVKRSNIPAKQIAAIGISNQRETTLIWERNTGKPIAPAIVWQDRRTTEFCENLNMDSNIGEMVTKKTGLLLDPYFSASKIAWLLDSIPNARARAEKGELAFGTIDTFLLWRLTGGKRHATDASNASRTMIFNIHEQRWDDELLNIFRIPKTILPEVLDNCADFGVCDENIVGAAIPITGMAGDQQAATVGQACFKPGMVKSTFGTGSFLLLNTGDKVVRSKNRLISTVAYRIHGKVTYGLEGSIFIAGAAIQWLRDSLNIINSASETQALATSVEDTGGVYMVPAFTGLGAPYWDPKARGALLGLTRDSRVPHIVRAALEAVCYQTRDLKRAMSNDYKGEIAMLRVDGGMVANDWLLQFLTDILGVNVGRPKCIETSVLGAAYLAGLGAGVYASLDEIATLWERDRRFEPQMSEERREKLYRGWLKAVERVCL